MGFADNNRRGSTAGWSGYSGEMDLFVKRRGKPGRLLKNDDRIDLDEPGIEKFYSQESSSEAGI